MQRSMLLVILSAALLSACANLPANPPAAQLDANGRPAWIESPGKGAVGFAGVNVYGSVKQHEMAVARARAEFANRFGVSVQATQDMVTNLDNGHANSQLHGNTHQETNQTNVQCQITEEWRDVPNDVMWVLCMPSK